MNHADVDKILEELLVLRDQPPGTNVKNVEERHIQNLLNVARATLLEQPMLLELNAPVKICGDLHGQYSDLLRIFDHCGLPPGSRYLFLGDYVDRGRNSIEVMCLLLALKVKHPDDVFLLRGNHECATLNRRYGFYRECKKRYSTELWKTFTDCFNCLPVAAVVGEKIFCCHGGLSPSLCVLDQIRVLPRPSSVPHNGLMCDLLWSDPSENCRQGWSKNPRGVSYTFGVREVRDFLSRFDLELVVRAHEMVDEGYKYFAGRSLLTVFSAPSYTGKYHNSGAVLDVNGEMLCSFTVFRPEEQQGDGRGER